MRVPRAPLIQALQRILDPRVLDAAQRDERHGALSLEAAEELLGGGVEEDGEGLRAEAAQRAEHAAGVAERGVRAVQRAAEDAVRDQSRRAELPVRPIEAPQGSRAPLGAAPRPAADEVPHVALEAAGRVLLPQPVRALRGYRRRLGRVVCVLKRRRRRRVRRRARGGAEPLEQRVGLVLAGEEPRQEAAAALDERRADLESGRGPVVEAPPDRPQRDDRRRDVRLDELAGEPRRGGPPPGAGVAVQAAEQLHADRVHEERRQVREALGQRGRQPRELRRQLRPGPRRAQQLEREPLARAAGRVPAEGHRERVGAVAAAQLGQLRPEERHQLREGPAEALRVGIRWPRCGQRLQRGGRAGGVAGWLRVGPAAGGRRIAVPRRCRAARVDFAGLIRV